MRTIDAAKGRWKEILGHYGVSYTGTKHTNCYFCDKVKSMRITEAGWICTCGNGSHIDIVLRVTGRDFATVAGEIDKLIGNTPDEKDYKKPVDKSVDIIGKWKSLRRLQGTCGEAYLNERGIFHIPLRALKFGRASIYETGFSYDALIAIATDSGGKPCYVHKTYLEGNKKADIKNPKRLESLCETYDTVAIKLYETATALGIAEGIETALSAKRLYEVNTWSVMNTSFMKRFVAPAGVEHLYIFADNDSHGAGLAAAFHCANKNILTKNDVKRVTVRWCEAGDFNDQLHKSGAVFEWGLSK